MPKIFFKHKLLLDEHMPPRSYFPHLNELFDVKHVEHDLKKGGSDDKKVYEISVALSRIIITNNWPDFLQYVGRKNGDTGIIGIGGTDWHRIDTKLTALLIKYGAHYFSGNLRTLGEEEKKLRS